MESQRVPLPSTSWNSISALPPPRLLPPAMGLGRLICGGAEAAEPPPPPQPEHTVKELQGCKPIAALPDDCFPVA